MAVILSDVQVHGVEPGTLQKVRLYACRCARCKKATAVIVAPGDPFAPDEALGGNGFVLRHDMWFCGPCKNEEEDLERRLYSR